MSKRKLWNMSAGYLMAFIALLLPGAPCFAQAGATPTPVAAFPEASRPLDITPNLRTFTVVLTKNGQVPTSYPLLEFSIGGGVEGQKLDVQVEVGSSSGLSGGPGLPLAWNASELPAVRQTRRKFSSWSNGDTALSFDASGHAAYQMPLEWWRDLARLPLAVFNTTIPIYFRVISFASPSTPVTGSSNVSSVSVRNNLIGSAVLNKGYIYGGLAMYVELEFTVREPNTNSMYTMVQWMQGSCKKWRGAGLPFEYGSHKIYSMPHDASFPNRTIDRVYCCMPQYNDDTYSTRNPTQCYAMDKPGLSGLPSGYTHFYASIDFETFVHLNFDVPERVDPIVASGQFPNFGIVTGIMTPQPLTLTSKTWELRVLLESGKPITHPAVYGGP